MSGPAEGQGSVRSPPPASAGASRPTPPRSPHSLLGLLPYLRPYGWRIALAVLLLLLAAASMLAMPAVVRLLIDHGLLAADPGRRMTVLREHFALVFMVGAALAVFAASRSYAVSWLGERVTADVRRAVYAHVIRQSPEFFESARTGEVLSRLTADTTLVQVVVCSSMPAVLRHAVVGTGALALLVASSLSLMAQVLAVLVLVLAPAMVLGRRLKALSRASQDRMADASAIAAEVLNAVPIVQGCVQEPRESARFGSAVESTFDTACTRMRLHAALQACINSVAFGSLMWGLYQGTQAVLAGRISAGHLGQTVMLVTLVVKSMASLSELWGSLLRAAGATERLMELLAARSPVQEPAQPLPLPAVATASALAFDRVTFGYPSRPQQPALREFSLRVRAGETVALVGPSGAGKSTVFQLLLRFYDPQQGRLSLDGVAVDRVPLAALRERIGIVPQDGVVFSASALDNIRYARPQASEEEVFAAARAAHAHDFISALPQGYHTHLGERGVRLSGGQRQRIGIARAMLKNPPLLLLDEATSALDAESERMVQAALVSAMRHRTTLVIAHRLATVQRADRIVVMEAGRVVDAGTHDELMTRGGLYARLAAMQFGPAQALQPA